VPQTSAANVNQLNVSTATLGLLSASTKLVSSLTVDTLTTTNAIVINSPFVITNLSAPGIVTVQSSLTVYGNVLMDKQLFVSGPTVFQSSLFVTSLLPISSVTRIVSSVGIGGALSVGGTLVVLSTLETASTNTIETLQVQRSTTDVTTEVFGTFQINGVLSTLLSLTVLSTLSTLQTLRIEQTVSSLSGTVCTTNLVVGANVFVKGSVSTAVAVIPSSVTFTSSFLTTGSLEILKTLFVQQEAVLSSLSSFYLSTVSSFSTGFLTLPSTSLFQGGLSTAFLSSLGWMSIGGSVHTTATVSSLAFTTIGGALHVFGESRFSSVFVSSSATLGTIETRGFVSAGTALFQNTLSVDQELFVGGFVSTGGNVGVGGNVFVDGDVTITKQSQIPSFGVNSFLLSNLHVMTSSPFTAVTASTLIASTVQTSLFLVSNSDTLSVQNTFASTVRAANAITEDSRFTTGVTCNLLWGTNTSFFASDSKPRFVLDVNSAFPQGLSAPVLRVSTATADFLAGRFIGDAANVSNVAISFTHLSVATALASTISTGTLFTSSLFASTFINTLTTTVFSSFQSPTLAIEGVGYTPRIDTNQILLLSPTIYSLNNLLFIDTLNNRVGVNISSPTVDLDISGGFYSPGGIQYSSITPFYMSSSSNPLILSTLFTADAFIRDSLFVSTGFQLLNPNIDSNGTTLPSFFVQQGTSTIPSTFGLFSLPSSLGLLNVVHVFYDTQRVLLNGSLEDGSLKDPTHALTTRAYAVTDYAYVSCATVEGMVQSETLTHPSLLINPSLNVSTNTMSTTVNTLFLNLDLMVLKNTMPPQVGIKTTNPGANASLATLDVNGQAFFSTLFLDSLQTDCMSLGSLFV
jgi:hypothetical protein